MAATLGDLLAIISTMIIENPDLEKASVYDGEGNPFENEIGIDDGDVFIYFE